MSEYNIKDLKISLILVSFVLSTFILAGSFGILMRTDQANLLSLDPTFFYTILTFHGLLNVVIFFLAPFFIARALLTRYVYVNQKITIISLILIVFGAFGTMFSLLAGNMALGWYFLYPIIFYDSTEEFRIIWDLSILSLGFGILLLALDNIRSIVKKYGFTKSLAWHYFKGNISEELPPIALISMVSSIATIFAAFAGAMVIIEFLGKDLLSNTPVFSAIYSVCTVV